METPYEAWASWQASRQHSTDGEYRTQATDDGGWCAHCDSPTHGGGYCDPAPGVPVAVAVGYSVGPDEPVPAVGAALAEAMATVAQRASVPAVLAGANYVAGRCGR